MSRDDRCDAIGRIAGIIVVTCTSAFLALIAIQLVLQYVL